MKIKILIVEDEVLVAEDTADDLKRDGFEVTDIAISADEALASIQDDLPHVILMDINIKGKLDGIELAEKINQDHTIPVIYLTSNTSSQFVNRAIETMPHAFLSKPYQYKDLVISIELATKKFNENAISNKKEIDSIFVKDGEYHTKLPINEIQYIEADGSYCNVYSSEGKYTLSFNLNHFQNEVGSPKLMRVHRSYIVNVDRVSGFDKNTVLVGDKIIPVSNSHKEKVFTYFKKV